MKTVARGDLLLPYQQRAVAAMRRSQLLVIEKSRRIGLTWALAAEAVLTAGASDGRAVYYMGYNLEMAREFISVCGMWAKAFGIGADAAGEVVLSNAEQDVKAFRVRLASGREIVALPSAARVLRGMQGTVILDEAAFMGDLDEVLKAALALLIWNGRVVVVSTHDGVDNPFNLLVNEVRSGVRRGATLRVTFNEALSEGLYDRIRRVSKNPDALPPRDEWAAGIRAIYGDGAGEELDCVPRTGSGSWIDPALIVAAESPEAGLPELYEGGPCYIGWDVARRRDLSVMHLYERVGPKLIMRERILMQGATFSEQHARLDRLIDIYHVVAVRIDQTGMGEAVAEAVQESHGLRAEGVLLTGPNRIDLATGLRQRFEDGTISIVADDALRIDLRSLKRVSGPTGAVRLVEEGAVHPDEFWAAALASAGADVEYQPFDYQPATPIDDDDGFRRPGLW